MYGMDMEKQLEQFQEWKENKAIIRHYSDKVLKAILEEKRIEDGNTNNETSEIVLITGSEHRMQILNVEKLEENKLQVSIEYWPCEDKTQIQKATFILIKNNEGDEQETIGEFENENDIKFGEPENRLLYESKQDDITKLMIDEDTAKLLEFMDDNVYIISVVGPSRSGKSWFMEKLKQQFEPVFGQFVDVETLSPMTRGMNIAVVKSTQFDGKILLIDSEGMNSVEKKVDPRLMLITAMISDKLFYIARDLDDRIFDNLSVLCEEAKHIQDSKIQTGNKKLHIIRNMCSFAPKVRDKDWFKHINTKMHKNEKAALTTFFIEQTTNFIQLENDNSYGINPKTNVKRVEEDMQTLTNIILEDLKIRSLNSLKMADFLSLVRQVLKYAEEDSQLDSPSSLDAWRRDRVLFLKNQYIEDFQKFKKTMTKSKQILDDATLLKLESELKAKKNNFALAIKRFDPENVAVKQVQNDFELIINSD
jgi:hypothetical protein